MSQNDCFATISYCATVYVTTAVQCGSSAGEVSGLTGLRQQDSQTIGCFARRDGSFARFTSWSLGVPVLMPFKVWFHKTDNYRSHAVVLEVIPGTATIDGSLRCITDVIGGGEVGLSLREADQRLDAATQWPAL
jgi:hypothetical protein